MELFTKFDYENPKQSIFRFMEGLNEHLVKDPTIYN